MLTKSNYLAYRQCPKRLWLEKNRRDLLPAEIDPERAKLFAEGDAVERLATQLFPGYADASDDDFNRAIGKSRRFISRRAKAIYQPTVIANQLFCRADFIARRDDGGWDLYEVKASTRVKDEHLPDLAFQKAVMEQAGLDVGRCFVVHVNGQYRRQGEIDVRAFLTVAEVTEEVNGLASEVESDLPPAFETIDEAVQPEVLILNQCYRPYECPFVDYCWQGIPEMSIYQLALDDARLAELLKRNVTDLADVPEEMVTASRKRRFLDAYKRGQPLVDRPAIKQWLKSLEYPLHFLDYETYSTALPPFDGYRPYQQMVFQYSLDVQEKPGGPLRHHEHLATNWGDPAPALSDSLAEAIGPTGNVIVWYRNFESSRNDELGELCPKHEPFFRSVNERIMDLMEPFSDGLYVDGRFGGSASIKKVLPVLAPDLSYDRLAIGHGGEATLAWRRMVDRATAPAEQQRIAKGLLEYCGQDTMAMVRILEVLKKTV